mmetsp:Transcript_9481/g.23027  ORF Transcript_9481/g.23027 Transcript_9481/m.23027 type:complete len:792 (+) Transcript_9481:1273-3648(+)
MTWDLFYNFGYDGLLFVIVFFSFFRSGFVFGFDNCVCGSSNFGLIGHESHNSLRKATHVFNVITRRHSRYIEQESCIVLGFLCDLVLLDHSRKVHDDGVLGVDFHANLVHAVQTTEFLSTGHRLGLHVTLHAGAHSVGSLHQGSRGVGEQIGHRNLFDILVQDGLEVVDDVHVFSVQFFLSLCGFFVIIVQLEGVLSGILDVVIPKAGERFEHDLIQRFGSVENVKALALELFGDGGHGRSLLAFSGDVVDGFLVFGHVGNVVFQACVLLSGVGAEESQVFGHFFSVSVVLDNSYLQVLSKVVPKHDVVGTLVALVLGNVPDHVQRLAHETLVDDGEDLGFLQDFTTDVQGKVVGIDNSLDEFQPAGHEVLELIVDEDALDVQTDVARVLVEHVLGQFKGEHARNVKNGLALDLSLQHEMGGLHGFVVTGFEGGLVEFLVFVFFDFAGRSQPDWLLVVDGFVSLDGLGDRFHFWFLALGQVLVGFLVGDLFVLRLFLPYGNRKLDEFRIPGEQFLDLGRLEIGGRVLLQLQNELGSGRSLDLVGAGLGNRVIGIGLGFPSVGLAAVLHRFGDDRDLVGDQVGGIKSDPELSDEVDVRLALSQRLDKGAGPGLGDLSEVVDDFVLGHAHTGILDGDGVGGLVALDFDRGRGLLGVFRDGQESFLVAGIGGVGNQFAEENIAIGIERVDDQVHDSSYIAREFVGFGFGFGSGFGGFQEGHRSLQSVVIIISLGVCHTDRRLGRREWRKGSGAGGNQRGECKNGRWRELHGCVVVWCGVVFGVVWCGVVYGTDF